MILRGLSLAKKSGDMPTFADRREAGNVLAKQLRAYAGRRDVVVLGLAPGGVPVAAEVARELDAPLDVLVVRTLALPGFDELTLGAIGPAGVTLLDWGTVARSGVTGSAVATLLARERADLHRREMTYRGDAPTLSLSERTVILVDDGLTSGAAMRAAISAARGRHASRIVVAVPVCTHSACTELLHEADEIEGALTPEPFDGVSPCYRDFKLPSDDEVRRLIRACSQRDLRYSARSDCSSDESPSESVAS